MWRNETVNIKVSKPTQFARCWWSMSAALEMKIIGVLVILWIVHIWQYYKSEIRYICSVQWKQICRHIHLLPPTISDRTSPNTQTYTTYDIRVSVLRRSCTFWSGDFFEAISILLWILLCIGSVHVHHHCHSQITELHCTAFPVHMKQ